MLSNSRRCWKSRHQLLQGFLLRLCPHRTQEQCCLRRTALQFEGAARWWELGPLVRLLAPVVVQVSMGETFSEASQACRAASRPLVQLLLLLLVPQLLESSRQAHLLMAQISWCVSLPCLGVSNVRNSSELSIHRRGCLFCVSLFLRHFINWRSFFSHRLDLLLSFHRQRLRVLRCLEHLFRFFRHFVST